MTARQSSVLRALLATVVIVQLLVAGTAVRVRSNGDADLLVGRPPLAVQQPLTGATIVAAPMTTAPPVEARPATRPIGIRPEPAATRQLRQPDAVPYGPAVPFTSDVESPDGLVFVLVAGSDARPGERVDRSRADSIHLLAVNPSAGTGTVLGFPRDAWVEIPGHGRGKISSAMALGGPDLLSETVQRLTGLPVHWWVVTSFDGLVAMVDALDRVVIPVERRMADKASGAYFERGLHNLSGREVLAFTRDRKSVAKGDFSRSANHGVVVLSTLRKMRTEVSDMDGVARWARVLWESVRIDAGFDDVVRLGAVARQLDPDRLTNVVAPGEVGHAGRASVVYLTDDAERLFDDLRDDVDGRVRAATDDVDVLDHDVDHHHADHDDGPAADLTGDLPFRGRETLVSSGPIPGPPGRHTQERVLDAVPYIAAGTAIAGLALAAFFFSWVKAKDPGNERMVELMTAIQQGARAFIRREYTWVAGFVVLMTILIFVFLDYGRPWGAIAYITGAVLSALAGYIGMTIATLANARTAEAARTGPQLALPLAFRGGAVMGFTVAGLSLLGIAVSYVLYVEVLDVDDPFSVLTAFALGASSIALFSRVGGGIYTKAADVGADLVGKVEAGIPEDDPRNPATIADNVGDNVGDVAGMGADLFESYSGSIIAPIALAAFIPFLLVDGVQVPITLDRVPELFLYPLAIAAVGMVASIIGAFMVKSSGSSSVHDLGKALHRGTNAAAALTVLGVFGLAAWMLSDSEAISEWWGLPIAVVGGLVVGYAIGKVAEIWTSDAYGPVKKIAQQSETGPATTILGGISAGMVSVCASVLLVAVGIAVAYWGGEQAAEGLGIYGIAVAAIGMLATTGVVVSVDAYGPIADNAGGIAEMAHMPPEVREVTDSLDSLGNTTAAVAKGFAVGSAALTALALFKAFEASLLVEGHSLDLNVGKVEVFIGLFLGAMLPFLFASLTIDAVGRAANKMIEEVRRQFREIPGLREGREDAVPEYAKCVDISTAAALREMLVPGGLAIVVPLVIGFVDVDALGGFLAGALVVGFCLAIFMANAGGAWDNAKKYIEAGHHGGKGSEPHKAAVVGDTVGDPFKDTSGPAMNILIKVMTIVSLIFASAFV